MKYTKIIAAISALIMLTSCTAGGTGGAGESKAGNSSNQNAAGQTETSKEEAAEPDYSNLCMQRLSIRTVSQDPKVMDFVTVPIARFVSDIMITYTPGFKIPKEPYYEACTVTLRDPDGSILVDGAQADVKVRGNWTTTYDKKPLRIRFNEKQSMGDLNDGNAFRNWVLLAEYKDASMLRNKAALSMAREICESDGLYASDAEFVEVDINGEYWGVYLLAELQQVNENRVNINDPEKDYQGTDIGYFLEYDNNYYAEDESKTFVVDYADNAPLKSFNGDKTGKSITVIPKPDGVIIEAGDFIGMTIKSDIYSQKQRDFIADYINNVYRIMYSASYENKAYVFNDDYTKITESSDITPEEAVKKVVDLNSLADMYIISELTCDADVAIASFFMDVDFSADGDKILHFEAPWDFDSAMGNKDRCADGTGFYAASAVPDVNANDSLGIDAQYETINPWLAVLMPQSWYTDIIREKWTKAYDDGVFERGLKLIENDKAEYKTAFENNYKKWGNIGKKLPSGEEVPYIDEIHSKAIKCKTEEEAADYLHGWLENRVKFLNDYWHK
ncbi:CotH kinase family protein [Ruminococcus sp. HUN007]|uniref:CotH kinase family protein n=1 Tax=Ruminococcus sp. HUN007 TaxID=1514668 RepID=UPI0005D15D33|nr:CotH kinase family protein [Ruminococcus sp. HUN007]